VLNLLLVTLGLAWLTQMAGLSLALGPSLPGILISETEYKHQVETDIRPFHDVLLGLFFITIGMLLDWRPVSSAGAGAGARDAAGAVQAAAGDGPGQAVRRTMGVSLRTGLYLAQAGEFGFVLLAMRSRTAGAAALLNPILASMVLSMLATPFIIQWSNRIVMKLVASEWLMQSLQMTQIARKSDQRQQARDHLRLRPLRPEPGAHAGAGRHPYMALDLDPDRVRQAAAPATRWCSATPRGCRR
jgi:CPA2 family monovalent cation:H+ antiporter-2